MTEMKRLAELVVKRSAERDAAIQERDEALRDREEEKERADALSRSYMRAASARDQAVLDLGRCALERDEARNEIGRLKEELRSARLFLVSGMDR